MSKDSPKTTNKNAVYVSVLEENSLSIKKETSKSDNQTAQKNILRSGNLPINKHRKKQTIKPADFDAKSLSYSENILVNLKDQNREILNQRDNYSLVKYFYKNTDKYALTKLLKNLNPLIFKEIGSFHNFKTEQLTLKFINENIKLYKKDELVLREDLNLIIFIIKKGFMEGMTFSVLITLKYLISIFKEYNLNGIEEIKEFLKILTLNLENRFIYKGDTVELEEQCFGAVFNYIMEILNMIPLQYITPSVIEKLLMHKSIKVKKFLYKVFRKNSSMNFLKPFIKHLDFYFLDLLSLFEYEDVFISLFNEIFFLKEKNDNSLENINLEITEDNVFDISDSSESSLIKSQNTNNMHKFLFRKHKHNEFLFKLLLTTSINKIHSKYYIKLIFNSSLFLFQKYFDFLMNLFSETKKINKKLKDQKPLKEEIIHFHKLIEALILFFNSKIYLKKSDLRTFFEKQKIIKENKNILISETNKIKEPEFFCKNFNGFLIFFLNFFNENFNIFIRKYLRNSEENIISFCFFSIFLRKCFKKEKILEVKTIYFLISHPNFLETNNFMFLEFLKNLSPSYLIKCILEDQLYNEENFNIIFCGFFQQIRQLYLITSLNKDIKDFLVRFSNGIVDLEVSEDLFLIIKREEQRNNECINGKEFVNISLFNQFGELIEYRSDQSTIHIENELNRLCLDPFE